MLVKGGSLMMLLAASPVAATPGSGGLFAQFVPLLVMLLAFYFFLLRPQQQQSKRRQEMLSKLERGQKVITVGGLHGEIVAIREDVLTLRIAEKVEVKINRTGVAQVQ
jgi:preprotein translocase subunit YajC